LGVSGSGSPFSAASRTSDSFFSSCMAGRQAGGAGRTDHLSRCHRVHGSTAVHCRQEPASHPRPRWPAAARLAADAGWTQTGPARRPSPRPIPSSAPAALPHLHVLLSGARQLAPGLQILALHLRLAHLQVQAVPRRHNDRTVRRWGNSGPGSAAQGWRGVRRQAGCRAGSFAAAWLPLLWCLRRAGTSQASFGLRELRRLFGPL
jgi:hypothetical protein